MRTRLSRTALVAGIVIAAAGAIAVPAQGDMKIQQINDHLCKVTGGGKFVKIPGFPGEKIDKRLRADIKWMKRKYDIFITDGYAPTGHAAGGEHPIGLAADIIPDGSSWGKIDDLAHRFEPRQNHVRPPMRWVGYDGDEGHGRGNHLHLSWSHSDTRPKHPARVVYTRVCPGDGGGGGGGSGGTGGGGGVEPRKSGTMTPAEIANLAPVVPETEEHDGYHG
jgi:hypothetical protein